MPSLSACELHPAETDDLREETQKLSTRLQTLRDTLADRLQATKIDGKTFLDRFEAAKIFLQAEESALQAAQEAHDNKLADLEALLQSLLSSSGDAGQRVRMLESLNKDLLKTQRGIAQTREEERNNAAELQELLAQVDAHQASFAAETREREELEREMKFYSRQIVMAEKKNEESGDSEEVMLRNELKAANKEIQALEAANEQRAAQIAAAQEELKATQEAVREYKNLEPIKIKPPVLPGATVGRTRRKGAPRNP